jgi:hypothetical protein
MDRFFEKLPVVYYNGIQARDLTRRVKISTENGYNLNLYNPLELKANIRADHVADAYYEDAEMDWLVYLANDIVDPYYEWYLNEHEFQDYINHKYGDVTIALKKVKMYRNNWPNDDTRLPPDFYNTNLPDKEKPYWSPLFGAGANIVSYKRKEVNWTQNTNRVLEYEIELQSNTEFQVGELVDIIYSMEPVGAGEVVFANSSALIIQSVSGNTIANTTWPKNIVGETSKANAATTAMYTRAEPISLDESKYWSPVSYFEWEIEMNEAKKALNIVDNTYAMDVSELTRQKLLEE